MSFRVLPSTSLLAASFAVLAAACSPPSASPPRAPETSASAEMRIVPEVGKLAHDDGWKSQRQKTSSRSKGKPHFRDRLPPLTASTDDSGG